MRVVGIKLAKRVAARWKAIAKEQGEATATPPDLGADVQWDESDSDTFMEGNPDDAQSEAAAVEDPLVMEEEFVVNHGKSVCSVGLGNLDLGHITNGFPGDPIEKRPFDFSFRR